MSLIGQFVSAVKGLVSRTKPGNARPGLNSPLKANRAAANAGSDITPMYPPGTIARLHESLQTTNRKSA